MKEKGNLINLAVSSTRGSYLADFKMADLKELLTVPEQLLYGWAPKTVEGIVYQAVFVL